MSTHIILGPPGTGKTQKCLDIVESYIAQGCPPDRIGYFAFTRRANLEAKSRAMLKFSLASKDLPYFKTLHSLAFGQLGIGAGQLMNPLHYTQVSEWLKVGRFFIDEGTSGPFKDAGYGDKYLSLISLARLKQVSLRSEYQNSPARYAVDWNLVDYVSRGLAHFKKTFSIYDYTDLLEQFVERDVAPRLEVVVVDEAQDLSPLQWAMVGKLQAKAKHIYVAGDDDQAIYRWAGADVNTFINFQGEQEILRKSHRIPAAHHRMSQLLIGKLHERRIVKEFEPRDEEGVMRWYRHSEAVDIAQGEWLMMARTTKGTNQLEEEVRYRGYLYRYDNSSSTDSAALRAVILWEQLRNGSSLLMEDVKRIYRYMKTGKEIEFGSKTMPKGVEGVLYNFVELQCDHGLRTTLSWRDALPLISERDRQYISACIKKGESLTHKPRITISTIHRAKGAQADNCLLLTDTGQPRMQERTPSFTDDECRTFYVGLTRAKQSLHLVHPMFSSGYSLPC